MARHRSQHVLAAERARRLGPSRPESYLAQGTYERLDPLRSHPGFQALVGGTS